MDFYFSNAFNKVSRQEMLNEFAENFPQIAKWMKICYKTPPILRINVENSLHGESGTSQGDPCAPFAFALVLHKQLKRMGTLNLETNLNAWYLDDWKIIAKHAILPQARNLIHSEDPALGLVLNLSKCTVWWPTPNNAELAQYNPDIQRVALGGIKFIGSPLGSPEFADNLLRKRVSKIEGLMCTPFYDYMSPKTRKRETDEN
jgi:Reverse transcriptase (RNA-dependent DNA polymerase)